MKKYHLALLTYGFFLATFYIEKLETKPEVKESYIKLFSKAITKISQFTDAQKKQIIKLSQFNFEDVQRQRQSSPPPVYTVLFHLFHKNQQTKISFRSSEAQKKNVLLLLLLLLLLKRERV
jgi:hypothetical protein